MPDITIQELRNMLAELAVRQEETRKMLSEKFSETDAMFKETKDRCKDTDKKVKEAFDLFTTQWGKLMESLVEGDLVRILNERGILVSDTTNRRKGRRDGKDYEFDIIAHNGHEITIVEVKTTLRPEDVKWFVDKLAQAKTFLPEYANYTIYGAVAYLQANAGAPQFAEKSGLFVIRATGDSAAIINATDFTPKKF